MSNDDRYNRKIIKIPGQNTTTEFVSQALNYELFSGLEISFFAKNVKRLIFPLKLNANRVNILYTVYI
jgi:hypothetical protein